MRKYHCNMFTKACGAGGYRLEGASPYEGVFTWRVLRWALIPAAVLSALALLVYFTSSKDSGGYDALYPDPGPRLVTLEGEHFSLDETKVTYHLPDSSQPVSEPNSTVRIAEVFEIVPETDVEVTEKESEHFEEEEEEEDFDTSESKPATLSDRRPTGRPYQVAPGDRSFVDRLISSFEHSRLQRPSTSQTVATRGPIGQLVSTSQGLLNRRIPNGHKYADYPVQPDPTEEVRTGTAAPPRVSPTLPSSKPTVHVVSLSSSTTNQSKQTNESDSVCASPRLSLCRGVLPWDLTATTPMVPGLPSLAELDAVMPYFEMLASTGCSPRIRPFLCSLLEPECRSVGYNILPPCRKACRVVEEECRDFILDSLDLSQAFNCDYYPDSDNEEECVNLAKGEKCLKNEYRCSDGSCIPWRWACDKARDCPLGEDETNCTQCTQDEFRCAIDQKCIPLEWKCDRRKDCTDGSDEFNCKMAEVAMAHSHTSPCPSGELRCVDGRCITLAQICDRVHDCSDGADEANCSPPPALPT